MTARKSLPHEKPGSRDNINPRSVEGLRNIDPVLILPEVELHRMTSNSLQQKKLDSERALLLAQEKEDLKQKTKDTVKQWNNTIEGNRIRKLERRKIQAELDEHERQKLDAEEEEHRNNEREKALTRAEQLLYYQVGRVKHLHRALVLSHVQDEREQQVRLKKEIDERKQKMEKEYLEIQINEKTKKDEDEVEAKKQRMKAALDCRSEQIKQAVAKSEKQKNVRDNQIKEQRELDAQAEKYFLDEKLTDQEKRDKRILNAKELEEFQQELVKIRKQEEEYDQIDDEKRKVFNDNKRFMVKKRKEREKEILGQLRNHQDNMIEKLSNYMSQQKDNEDIRILEAQKQTSMKKLKEEKLHYDLLNKANLECVSHLREVMNEQTKMQMLEIEKGREQLRERIEADEKFRKDQSRQQAEQVKQAKILQQQLMDQVKEESEKRKKEMEEDQLIADMNYKMLTQEENKYQDYANQTIEKLYEKGGKNVFPLTKAARPGAGGGHGPIFEGKGGIRPSIKARDATAKELPSYITHGQEPRNGWKLGQTKRRLGLTI